MAQQSNNFFFRQNNNSSNTQNPAPVNENPFNINNSNHGISWHFGRHGNPTDMGGGLWVAPAPNPNQTFNNNNPQNIFGNPNTNNNNLAPPNPTVANNINNALGLNSNPQNPNNPGRRSPRSLANCFPNSIPRTNPDGTFPN